MTQPRIITMFGAEVFAWLIAPQVQGIYPILLDRSYSQVARYLGLEPHESVSTRVVMWDKLGNVLHTVKDGMERDRLHLWQHPYSQTLHGGNAIVMQYNLGKDGHPIFQPSELVSTQLDAQEVADGINFLLGFAFERWDEIEIQDSYGDRQFRITPKLVRIQ